MRDRVAKGHRAEAEVVGFEEDRLYLMPLDPLQGIEPGARVIPMNMMKA